jgi:hypothetical protein
VAMSRVSVGIPRRFATPLIREELRMERVHSDGNPTSSYSEFIGYTKVLLCQQSVLQHAYAYVREEYGLD